MCFTWILETVTMSVKSKLGREAERDQTFPFFMVDDKWQSEKCQLPWDLTVRQTHVYMTDPIPCGIPGNIKPIRGDGNCLFRSLSYIITGSEEFHSTLRTLTVNHMDSIDTLMQQHLPRRVSSVVDQSSGMRQEGTWGTDFEIYTAAHMLQTNIYVYSAYGPDQLKWMCHSPADIDPALQTSDRSIYLYHRGGNHYEVVLSVESATSPPRGSVPESPAADQSMTTSNDTTVSCIRV